METRRLRIGIKKKRLKLVQRFGEVIKIRRYDYGEMNMNIGLLR